jgi:hypothetical protein
MDDADLEVLQSLDGLRWEAAEGYVVESGVHRTTTTLERPHGVTYALVFRPEHGEPFVRFDSAHAASRPGGRFVKRPKAHDHWHRHETDPGRPYAFTTGAKLLDDIWREVKRAMDESGILDDL